MTNKKNYNYILLYKFKAINIDKKNLKIIIY